MNIITGRPLRLIVLPLGLLGMLIMAIALVAWHFPPLLVLVLVLAGVGVAVLSIYPYYGVQAFVMLLFFENVIPSGEGITLMKALGVIIISSWLLNMTLQRSQAFRFEPLTIAMALFLGWCSTSLLYALDSSISSQVLMTFAQLALSALMFSTVVDTTARMRGVYWAVVLWAGLSTVIAIAMYYAGMTRVAVGLMGNRNLLAAYINLAIVCAYILLLTTAHRLGRVVLGLLLPIFFLGVALTLSRSVLIVLPITLLLVWHRVARNRGVLILFGSVMAICAVAIVLPDSFWKRARSIAPAIEHQGDTFGTRVRLWKIALRMVKDRPVTGVGAGNFVTAYPRYAHGEMETLKYVTHNAYLGIAAEMGLVGLALFLLLNVLSLREADRAVRVGRMSGARDLEMLGVATEVCLISFVLGGLSGNSESLKFLWMLFGLSLSLGRLAKRESPGGRASAPSPRLAPSVDGGVPEWSHARSGP